MLPADQIPQQMQMADGMVDLKNIDDMIATLSLRETGLALEANVDFKAGYQSLAYSMIHTPNLNKADLKAIPADAVALISLTLGGRRHAAGPGRQRQDQAAPPGSTSASQIFGNIEQISLFVVPPKESVLPQGPADAADRAVHRPGHHQPGPGQDAEAPDDPAPDGEPGGRRRPAGSRRPRAGTRSPWATT